VSVRRSCRATIDALSGECRCVWGLASMRSGAQWGHPGVMTLYCLVVDDDRCFLTAVRRMLEREGVSVDTAEGGDEALERVEVGWPDIVLMDVRLSRENGFDVVERLVASTRAGLRCFRQPAIIFISNYASEDFMHRIAKSPATGFLDKSTLCDHLSGEQMRELAATRPSQAVTGVGVYGSPGR
jgi:CheY-like chemotaxis protein